MLAGILFALIKVAIAMRANERVVSRLGQAFALLLRTADRKPLGEAAPPGRVRRAGLDPGPWSALSWKSTKLEPNRRVTYQHRAFSMTTRRGYLLASVARRGR